MLLDAEHVERLWSPGYVPSIQEQMDIYGAISAPSPESAYLFLTSFCKTLDPDQRRVALIPRWPYIRRLVGELWDGGNQHWRKTRQMMISWIACSYGLWEYQFIPGSFILYTSRAEKLVDDGGERSTVRSLLGRIRFTYVNLPRYARRDMSISFLKMAHPSTSANAIVGENANPNMGRSGNFSRVFLDEWAFVPNSEQCWAAVDRACPDNKAAISTFNLPEGNFYRLWDEKPHTVRFVQIGWWERPDRAEGMYVDENGNKRSPWYDTATATMTDDQVAREIDMNPIRSAAGTVLPEFRYERHMQNLSLDPDLLVYGCLDFGIGALTAGYIFQLSPKAPRMRMLADYEQANMSGTQNAQHLWALLQQLGYKGTKAEVRWSGDPAGNSREIASGSSVIREYQLFGFTNFTTPRVRVKDRIRLMRRLLLTDDIAFDVANCTMTPKRVAGWRYLVDENGNVKGDELPIKDIHGHLMDGWSYGAATHFPIDAFSFNTGSVPTPKPLAVPIPLGPERYNDENRDAFRPIMSGRREF